MLRLPERDVETKARHTVTIRHRFITITVTYFFSIFYYTFTCSLLIIERCERCERFSPTFIVKSLKLNIIIALMCVGAHSLA